MKYSYPKLANTACITYDADLDVYEIVDYASSGIICVTEEECEFLKALDGCTNPDSIPAKLTPREKKRILREAEREHILLKRRIRRVSRFTWLIPVKLFDTERAQAGENMKSRTVCFLLNKLLIFTFLPVLIIGFLGIFNLEDWNDDHILAGLILGIVTGLVLHEIGHAIAGFAYGARVFEMGLMIQCVAIGGYVAIDNEIVKNYRQRAQIDAAGVEMNFLLSGIYLIAYTLSGGSWGLLMYAGIANMMLGAFNLMLCFGLDGEHILCNLLHEDRFPGKSFDIVVSKELRKKLKKRGVNGYCTLAASYIFFAAHLSFVVYILAIFAEVFLWIKDPSALI